MSVYIKRSGGVGKESLMSNVVDVIYQLSPNHFYSNSISTNKFHAVAKIFASYCLFDTCFLGHQKDTRKKSLCKSTVLTTVLFRKCIVALKSIGICPVPL